MRISGEFISIHHVPRKLTDYTLAGVFWMGLPVSTDACQHYFVMHMIAFVINSDVSLLSLTDGLLILVFDFKSIGP